MMARCLIAVLCVFFSFIFGFTAIRCIIEPMLPWFLMCGAAAMGVVITLALESKWGD